MLESRYVHLHEALGLGAMWLNAGAKILCPDNPLPEPEIRITTPITHHHSVQHTAPTPRAQNARMAALQRVRAHGGSHHTATSIATQNPPSHHPETTAISTQTTVHAKIMVMSVCASLQDVATGKLFSGEDGVLLHKMLAAISLTPDDAYCTTWLKDLPDFNPQPPPEIVLAATPRVIQEWQNSGAKYLLLLGEFFNRDDVMAELNQFSRPEQRFTIAHPMRILKDPSLKRDAWTVLQQLQAALR